MENTESRLYFASDYMEGAHPAIMKKLMETNLEKTVAMVRIHIQKMRKKRSEKPAMRRRQKYSCWLAEHRPMPQ